MSPALAPDSLARTAHRVVLVVMAIVALVPALLALGWGWSLQQHRAQASALAVAWVVQGQGQGLTPALAQAKAQAQAAEGATPTLAKSATEPFTVGDLAALGAAGPTTGEARDIFAADGRALSSGGDAVARGWPTLVVAAELRHGGDLLGRVHIVRSLRPTLLLALALVLGGVMLALALWVSVFTRPIRVLRQTEGQLRSHAHHDVLTGLFNLEGLRHRLQRALARCETSSTRTLAVLLIDLDRFRIVNDSLGQPSGDALLRSVADRIRAVTRPTDTVARLSADQFAVLVEGIGGAAAAAGMARNLMRALAPSYLLKGSDTVVGLSVGVAVASPQAQGVDGLLKCAHAAMRAAKAGGGGRFKLYEATMDANLQQRLELELKLRRALRQEELFLLYQPIMDATGAKICAVEALVRWADPQRGTVSPAEFIPVLEETGLIVAAGQWVLSQACQRAASWRAAGGAAWVLSVNVSPRQFDELDFIPMLDRVLAETGFPATELQLEVTEGLLLDPSEDCLAKLDALAQRGVRLAIDDFGMGYSSLAYLKRFKLHTLKIDRMFVRDIASASQDAAIVRAIIDLGHGLGMRVTAEGVETEAQLHELRRLGCDSLQGYLFARPMTEADLKTRLALAAGGITTHVRTAKRVPAADAATAPADVSLG